jgi:hypothetical protein
VHTAYGNFDINPQPGERIIPYNYGRAPGLVWVDLQASESLHIGPRSEAAPPAAPLVMQGSAEKPSSRERPWTLTFRIEAQNLFNHNNPGLPVGVLSSPFFGRPISLASDFTSLTAANRSLSLHTSFSF